MNFDWHKKYFSKNHTFYVSHVIYESKNVRSIILNISKSLPYTYSPGDYVYARNNTSGWHKFSLTSSPLEKQIVITAKNIRKYRDIFDSSLKKNALQLTRSCSEFHLKNTNSPLVFIVENEGILPIISHLRTMKLSGNRINSLLLYQNYGDAYESFKSELRLLNRSKWFNLVEIYSHTYPPRKGQKLSQIKGRITKTLLKKILKKHNIDKSIFIVSGQKAFTNKTKISLKSLDINDIEIISIT